MERFLKSKRDWRTLYSDFFPEIWILPPDLSRFYTRGLLLISNRLWRMKHMPPNFKVTNVRHLMVRNLTIRHGAAARHAPLGA